MSSREIRQHCQLCDAGMNLLRNSLQETGLSARAHDKILRVDYNLSPKAFFYARLLQDYQAVNGYNVDAQLMSPAVEVFRARGDLAAARTLLDRLLPVSANNPYLPLGTAFTNC